MIKTQRIRMAKKPGKVFSTDDYTFEDINVTAPEAGEIVCATRYLSLDPYLAGMKRSWQGPQPEWSEGIIIGRIVAEVIESKHPDFSVGDWVTGEGGWQGFQVLAGDTVQKISVDSVIPASAYLGVLGASGLTAWVGVRRVLNVQRGETFVVSSAAGTVGSVAGQLAKRTGARVVGIAGGAKKCNAVVSALGFDACVDHTAADLEAQLSLAAGDGIDAVFENVGAKTLDPSLASINDRGRIAICGLIEHYFDDDAVSLQHFRKLLTAGLSVTGFRVFDYFDAMPEAYAEIRAGIHDGSISIEQTVTEGLLQAPSAYIAMLNGLGSGKQLVHLGN